MFEDPNRAGSHRSSFLTTQGTPKSSGVSNGVGDPGGRYEWLRKSRGAETAPGHTGRSRSSGGHAPFWTPPSPSLMVHLKGCPPPAPSRRSPAQGALHQRPEFILRARDTRSRWAAGRAHLLECKAPNLIF